MSDSSISEAVEKGLAPLREYITHVKEHVSEVPVRTKKYDPNCKGCQMELQRIHKKSDNLPSVKLSDKALASVSFTSLLCHLQMHTECVQYYCMKSELIEFRCTCSCHDKAIKQRNQKPIKQQRNPPAAPLVLKLA